MYTLILTYNILNVICTHDNNPSSILQKKKITKFDNTLLMFYKIKPGKNAISTTPSAEMLMGSLCKIPKKYIFVLLDKLINNNYLHVKINMFAQINLLGGLFNFIRNYYK